MNTSTRQVGCRLTQTLIVQGFFHLLAFSIIEFYVWIFYLFLVRSVDEQILQEYEGKNLHDY